MDEDKPFSHWIFVVVDLFGYSKAPLVSNSTLKQLSAKKKEAKAPALTFVKAKEATQSWNLKMKLS